MHQLSDAFESLTHENRVELGVDEPHDTLPPSDLATQTLRCGPPEGCVEEPKP